MNIGNSRADIAVPFDSKKLDTLMEEHGLEVLIASSKHNIRYLLGGYSFFFFDAFDAIGVSRYLPLFVYFKGRPDLAAYVGNKMEAFEEALHKFWLPRVINKSWGTVDAIKFAIDVIKAAGPAPRTIGIECAFLPADAFLTLQTNFDNSRLVDALVLLERLRAVKTEKELRLLREASERVVDSILVAFESHMPGSTKRELIESLKREEIQRGLTFEYCLATTGTDLNRAPSDNRWSPGEIASLDSGGNLAGYIGDLCRMGVIGEPDNELSDLLAEVDCIQLAARKSIRDGNPGVNIFEDAQKQIAISPNRGSIDFVAHGMGLITHEAPRLTGNGGVPYPGDDADRPLQAGMVISIETTLIHPVRGFLKLEDTIAVTETGYEAYGDWGRGWNIVGGPNTLDTIRSVPKSLTAWDNHIQDESRKFI